MASKGPSRALENMAIKWLMDNRHAHGPLPILECCGGHHTKADDKKHQKFGGICERDFLQLARESLWWRHVAILAGYGLAKINAPWTYKTTLTLRNGTKLENWPDEGHKVELPSLTEVLLKWNPQTKMVCIRTSRIV